MEGSIRAVCITEKCQDSIWYKLVDAFVTVAMLVTFPLQLMPAMEVLCKWFECYILR